MATNIFLGMPPPKIKEWIEKNYVKPEVDMTKVPLHFTANEDSSSISLVCYDDMEGEFIDSWFDFEYSMTGKDDDWSEYTTGQVVPLNKGETVYFRCPREKDDSLNRNKNGLAANYGEQYHKFIMEGSIKADGNIQFLLEKTGTMMEVPECCYWKMFSNCTSLTQAPILPATTLVEQCYYSMFSGCTSLTQAPALPAMTLTDGCYTHMFDGCTNLNNINVNFTDWEPSNATSTWVNGVSSLGTFTCPADLPEEFGESRIPTGWTVVRK